MATLATPENTSGKCHICGNFGPILFCALCDHWFCEFCRTEWFKRGLEAVKQLVGGRTEACCGPGVPH